MTQVMFLFFTVALPAPPSLFPSPPSTSLFLCGRKGGRSYSYSLFTAFVLKPERSRAGREAVVGMAGGSSGFTFLGVLLLAAILLQTVAVTVTVLYFTNVLNTVRTRKEGV